MKNILSILVIFIMFVPNVYGQDYKTKSETFERYNESIESRDRGISVFCRAEWPGDFSMQKYCRNQQEEGYRELWRIVDSFRSTDRTKDDTDANTAFGGCINDWVDETPDWNMLAYCMDRQYESWKQLR